MPEYEDEHERFLRQGDEMAGVMQSAIGLIQSSVMGMDRYEYKLVPLGELNEHGRDRWRVVPGIVVAPPGMEDGACLMERQVIASESDLAALLGLPREAA